MTVVLDELELTGLVTSITGLSAVGAAAILGETGDPTPGSATDSENQRPDSGNGAPTQCPVHA